MAARDVVPVAVSLTGPLGWMVALGSYIFGLGRGNARRQKIFRDFHQKRNAARGWKPGDNQILRAATGGAYEARVSAAQRSIDAVNALLGEIPAAPWLKRAKFGKSGKLYTLRDVQTNVVRQNRAVNEAKVKAQKEASAREAKVRRSQGGQILSDDRWRGGRGGSRGPFGTFTRGTTASTIQAELFSAAVGQWLGRKLDADSARERLSRSTNRRGALAHRPGQLSGRTGRTAAGDTGRLQPTAAGTSTGTQPGRVASQSQHPSPNKVGSQSGESQASKDARRVLEGSRSLPATVVGTGKPSGLAQLLGVGASTALFHSSGRFSTSSAGATSSLTSSLGQRLTPLNATGVQSGFEQPCRCPPKRTNKRKDGKERCKNPVVSRVTKDGYRTTKVKLECQPSKPKSAF